MKTLTLFCLLGLAGIGKAQIACTPTISYAVGSNGTVNFVASVSGASATPTGTFSWYYGTGSPVSTTATASAYTYTANGTYTVMLVYINAAMTCSASTSQVIVITNANCLANANFSVTPTGTPQVWNAIPAAPGNVASATWFWGDGSTSNTLYTSHTYSAAGTYSICLKVFATCGDSAISCFSYAIFRGSQSTNTIKINVVDPSTTTGINNNQAENLICNIYPNPSNGHFTLNLKGLNSGQTNISVYNLVGKLVYQSEAFDNNGSLTKDIQLNDASEGVYFVKVNSDNKVFTQKVIINK